MQKFIRGHIRMKKIISTMMVLIMMISMVSCGGGESESEKPGGLMKVGMITDTGTIDDKSFNQGTWEGISRYESENKTIEKKYLQPQEEQETDYMNAINDLVASGFQMIITSGYKFESAVGKSAEQHPDTSFVLMDGTPTDGKSPVKRDNVVSVHFNEHEAAFLVGIAAAMSTKTGKLGFIGGSEIPPVERFGNGFKAGVYYANKNLGTNAEIVDYVYQGTFNDTSAGQTLASGMYTKGIDIIFHAAGGVGVGVFNEAKQRAEKGEKVYVIGVDTDQYDFGKISDGTSVTLTSAIKRIDNAAYKYIDEKIKGTFPGGEIVTLSLADNGVGIPEENPNLSADILDKINAVRQEIIDEKITVPSNEVELKEFMK